jgi:hypothetical protein
MTATLLTETVFGALTRASGPVPSSGTGVACGSDVVPKGVIVEATARSIAEATPGTVARGKDTTRANATTVRVGVPKVTLALTVADRPGMAVPKPGQATLHDAPP